MRLGRAVSLALPLALALAVDVAQAAGPPPRVWANLAARRAALRLPLTECNPGWGQESMLCGTFDVYENRALGSGRRLSLWVVVIPSLAERPEPDPVFYLAGGPGGSASGAASWFAHRAAAAAEARHRAGGPAGHGWFEPAAVRPGGRPRRAAEPPARHVPARAGGGVSPRAGAARRPDAVHDRPMPWPTWMMCARGWAMSVSTCWRSAMGAAPPTPTHASLSRPCARHRDAGPGRPRGAVAACTTRPFPRRRSPRCAPTAAPTAPAMRPTRNSRSTLRGLVARLRDAPAEVTYHHPDREEPEPLTVTADVFVEALRAALYGEWSRREGALDRAARRQRRLRPVPGPGAAAPPGRSGCVCRGRLPVVLGRRGRAVHRPQGGCAPGGRDTAGRLPRGAAAARRRALAAGRSAGRLVRACGGRGAHAHHPGAPRTPSPASRMWPGGSRTCAR
jgi:hypothetical protein